MPIATCNVSRRIQPYDTIERISFREANVNKFGVGKRLSVLAQRRNKDMINIFKEFGD